jgi:sulfur-oxidizing protein SoxY
MPRALGRFPGVPFARARAHSPLARSDRAPDHLPLARFDHVPYYNSVLTSGERKMDGKRRKILQSGGALTLLSLVAAAGWLRPGDALAAEWNQAAFDAKTLDDTLKALGGSAPTQSKDIVFVSTPDIAENGAVVPIGITSSIPKTESIAILVEKNPNILAANFDIPQGTEPWVNTRVKMGQTSNVIALVKTADGKFHYASKEVKVTLGGCGG